MTEQPLHLPKKSTMVKTRVGVVKTSTFELPQDPNHVYGYKRETDIEGVGEIMSNWVTSNPSMGKEIDRKIVYSNVLAIKHGCVTAHAMRQYNIDHPNIRMKESLPTNSGRVDSNHEGPFGRKTKFADESMESIIQAKYTDFATEDADYPDTSHIAKMNYFPKPKATVASQAIIKAREKANEQLEKKHFVMSRFKNVKGTLSTQPNSSKKFEDGEQDSYRQDEA